MAARHERGRACCRIDAAAPAHMPQNPRARALPATSADAICLITCFPLFRLPPPRATTPLGRRHLRCVNAAADAHQMAKCLAPWIRHRYRKINRQPPHNRREVCGLRFISSMTFSHRASRLLSPQLQSPLRWWSIQVPYQQITGAADRAHRQRKIKPCLDPSAKAMEQHFKTMGIEVPRLIGQCRD